MASSNLVYDSSPAGKDIIFAFSTIQDGDPLDFSILPTFTVYVYDGSSGGLYGQDEIITTITSSVDDSLFVLNEEEQLVSVVVPWDQEEVAGTAATGISQYNPNFKGEIYAQLIIELPSGAGNYRTEGATPVTISTAVTNHLIHTKSTKIHKPDWMLDLEKADSDKVWGGEDRMICYAELNCGNPSDCAGVCNDSYISLMPLRADYIPGSCDAEDGNLRAKITFAGVYYGDCCSDQESPRAYFRTVVRTYDGEDSGGPPNFTAGGQLLVHSCPSDIPLPNVQLISVNPHSYSGGKRVQGVPIPKDNTRGVWVRLDIDAPVTFIGTFAQSNWGGNCCCGVSRSVPCACPGLQCNVDSPPNVFLDSLPNEDPWMAPSSDTTLACCDGCDDPLQLPVKSPYKSCQLMYKGIPSACSGVPQSGSAGYWSSSMLFQCGVSYNFWLKGVDDGG